MKKILFVDTGREYGGGTKSFLYLLRGLAAQKKYEIYAFFETDYDAGGRKISQIIEEAGAKFINFAPKKQPSKLKKELLRALGGQILAGYLYRKDYDYALCLLRETHPDILHLNNHFSTNLAYIAAANALNIAVVQHLRKNSPIEPFKLEILKKLNFTPVCVSNATYDFYAAQLKMPRKVVYNPVEAPALGQKKFETGEKLDALIDDKIFHSVFDETRDRCGEILNSASRTLAKISQNSGDLDNCGDDDADKVCEKISIAKGENEGQIRSYSRGFSQNRGELNFKSEICENEENAKFSARNLRYEDSAEQVSGEVKSTDQNAAQSVLIEKLKDKKLDLSQVNFSLKRGDESEISSENQDVKAFSRSPNEQNGDTENENPQKKCDTSRERDEACERSEIQASDEPSKQSSDEKSRLSLVKFDPQKVNIVMPANFLTLKGHELVFDALAGLKRRDLKIYFAGGGELKPAVKAKFHALITAGKAEYLGFVSRMDEIYAACDYALGFSSDEGLPRVVIEALGCGLGVVYSDIAVIREIYEISSKKQDFFIVERDAAALLACLENLPKPSSKSPDDAVIKAFSIENYLRGIDRIYSGL